MGCGVRATCLYKGFRARGAGFWRAGRYFAGRGVLRSVSTWRSRVVIIRP